MSNSCEELIREFTTKFGHYMSSEPTINIPDNVKNLRVDLINEETNEMIDNGINEENLVEIADGAADAVYVIVGTCITYGIPFDRVFMEVHRSNMTKMAVKAEQGQKYGTKTPKGPDYIPPDIKGILENPEKLTHLEQIAFGETIKAWS